MAISYETNERGTIEHEGMVVDLSEDALETGRLLSEPARSGGWCEWAAYGTTRDGRRARVYWEHKDDGETLPEDYDWAQVERIELVDAE